MRIVVVGLERDDALGRALAACGLGAHVVGVAARDAPTSLAGAALVVLAPACVGGADVVAVIHELRRANASLPILAVGQDDRAALAVALVKAGASDYVVAGGDDLRDAVRQLVDTPARPAASDEPIAGLVGTSRIMAEVRALVRVAPGAQAHVLLHGENGTGQ